MRTDHYLDTPDGCHSITKPLEKYINHCNGTVLQMKEKFGGLRVYVKYPPDENSACSIENSIRFAEYATSTMCCRCGRDGTPGHINGWIGVFCDDHKGNGDE